MAIRARPSRPVSAIVGAGLALWLLALAGCVEEAPPAADAAARLFTRGLDDIGDYYLQPVSSRRLALSAAAGLSRLDDKIAINDGAATPGSDSLALSYAGRAVAFYPVPLDADAGRWGGLLATIVAGARQASPRLAALPPKTIDTAVFDGMTETLDPFSRYADPDAARSQRAARDGFDGIGVTLDDRFRVVAVTPQSPAERAGIRPEDQIVAIDGIATTGRKQQEIVLRLRGPVGSPVALRVKHPGGAPPRDIELRRAYIIQSSVTMARDGDIAVFRIASFNHTTSRRVALGLAQFRQETGQEPAGIVLDLRSDPGGLLDQAVSLADLFIPRGPIVSTLGRHPASRQYFAAAGDSIAPRVPMAVLINGASASASEIVAAALQDAGRAIVIGTSSYGKGTVQTVLRLPNDGELIVTWARLVAPSGYFLQAHGVVPTLCTAGLGDGASALDAGLHRAAAVAAGEGPGLRPRAPLDDRAWTELRASCPPLHASPAVDLALAERVLGDPKLYAAVLRALPASAPAARAAQKGRPRKPALTGPDRALSSRTR